MSFSIWLLPVESPQAGFPNHHFDTTAVHTPPPKFTAPLVESAPGTRTEVCGGALLTEVYGGGRVKSVGCFRRGAPSLVFD